jgi:two-component system chemotaxis response regulator CheB
MDNPGPRPAALDVVAVAASAGGLAALSALLAALPAGFAAPIVLVQHLDPRHPSRLAEILGRRTALEVRQAEDGDRLRPGVVFVAPPDRHLVAAPGGVLALTSTERVHLVRPSADILFESVAREFGPRAVAVVLTGSGSDGSRGIRAVKAMRGAVIAQDEATSEHFSMPRASIRTGCVDLVLPLGEIAPRLVALVTPEAGP